MQAPKKIEQVDALLASIEVGLDALCQDSLECPLSHVDDPGIRDRGDEISDLFRQVRDQARALSVLLVTAWGGLAQRDEALRRIIERDELDHLPLSMQTLGDRRAGLLSPLEQARQALTKPEATRGGAEEALDDLRRLLIEQNEKHYSYSIVFADVERIVCDYFAPPAEGEEERAQ